MPPLHIEGPIHDSAGSMLRVEDSAPYTERWHLALDIAKFTEKSIRIFAQLLTQEKYPPRYCSAHRSNGNRFHSALDCSCGREDED
jgi:hypothetical protein